MGVQVFLIPVFITYSLLKNLADPEELFRILDFI
jgi:hypothetical protein